MQADALSENIFVNHSELAVAGRPLGEQQVVLPRQRDLLLPESLLPDKDIRLSERAKPSPEQVRAQKGREKHSASLCSLLQLPAGKCFTGPVVLVNLTGYVEDMGAAVRGSTLRETWPRPNPFLGYQKVFRGLGAKYIRC